MDRRKFISGVAGNLLAAPLVALGQTPAKTARRTIQAAASLTTLAANTARNLGPYSWSYPTSNQITSYSGIVYDPIGKRMLIHGGGHGDSYENDIRSFDLRSLTWSSLYTPTPYAQQTLSNLDADKMRFSSDGNPIAAHSYAASVVIGSKFYRLVPQSHCNVNDIGTVYGGRPWWYDMVAGSFAFSQYGMKVTPRSPWGPDNTAACLDPVSKQILLVAPDFNSFLRMWLYDPASDTVSASILIGAPSPTVSLQGDLVYSPHRDKFYRIDAGSNVYEITLDRTTFLSSTVALLSVTGTPPPTGVSAGQYGFAYDTVNRVVGGFVAKGTFYAFDPATRAWTAVSMLVEAGSVGIPNQAFFCIDFDPDSGCFILLSDAAASTTWAYRYSGTAPPKIGSNVNDLAITLDFGGGNVATFSGTAAVDQGDFIGEFVRQKCYLARNPAFPDWRVYLRVDADAAGNRIVGAGHRDEVIVEYGRSAAGAPTHITSPYTATITKAGVTQATYTVPKHWWYARWRYQTSPRPVVRTPATLKARGWIPNFGVGGLFGLSGYTNAIGWDGPMSAPRDTSTLGAFSNVMGAAGDNPQIGFLTEYAADYAINGSAASLTTLRTEGEWCGNWCMHIRDDATGAVLDVRNNKLRYKGDGGTINSVPAVDPALNKNFVVVETAHFYPCANLPWLLTDDPFYLEEMQFACNWQILYDAYHRTVQKLEGLVYPGQTRSFAWGLRDLFQLAASCPASVPPWLRPKSYWKSCIDDNKAYAMRYVSSPARIHKLFRTWTRTDANAGWMSSWLNAVTGMAVDQGFADWQPVFAWGVDMHIQMTNGTSGWQRQWPVPYYCIPNKATVWSNPTLYFSDTSADATTCTSWADFWSYYASGSPDSGGVLHTDASGHTIDASGWDGHTIMQQFYQSSPSYFLHLRAALSVAVTRAIPGAQACYDYIQSELTSSVMPHYKARGQARFSIDPRSGPLPPPPPPPPPAGTGNYQGIWWNAPGGSESGWGINFAHEGDIIFATWFTYDQTGQPWWLTMTANKNVDNTYTGTLYETRGPAFYATPFDPSLVTTIAVGSGQLTFSDLDNGTFAYIVNGVSQTKTITRQVFSSPVPTCTFGALTNLSTATNFQDIWWAYPPGSESGWGVNLNQQGDIIFATWFTYDFDGTPLWLVATAPKTSEGVYSGTLYQTTGPAFNAVPFNPATVATSPVGTAKFTFANGDMGWFEYHLQGFLQTKRIARMVFQTPGTACL